MMQVADDISQITQKLGRLRKSIAVHFLIRGLLRVLLLLIGVALLLMTLEGFRYFSASVRQHILFFYCGFGLLFLLVLLILAGLIFYNRINAYSDENLARRIARRYPAVKDALLNALQLHRMILSAGREYSRDLIRNSLQRTVSHIQAYSFRDIVPVKETKSSLRNLAGLILLALILTISFGSYYQPSLDRLLHPRRDYEIPLPFQIRPTATPGDIFGGDSIRFSYRVDGRRPDFINFDIRFPDYTRTLPLTIDSAGMTGYGLSSIRDDIAVEAYVTSRSIFTPWQRISSGIDSIRVIDRPEILQLKATLEPPQYTGLAATEQESNNTEFRVLPGTAIDLTFRTNKPVKEARLHFESGKQLTPSINNTHIRERFTVTREDGFRLLVSDERGVLNREPIAYRIRIIPDAYPTVGILSPESDLELTEALEIPLGIRIGDDFGFSRIEIRYRLVKKYLPDESRTGRALFPLSDPGTAIQEIYHLWQIDSLSLSPEDVVEYWIEVYDNDRVNGPKSSRSRVLRARFPSLNDLFRQVDEKSDQIYAESEEVLTDMEATRESLAKISRELLKKENLKWEQKKHLEREIEKVREAGKRLSDLAERLDEVIEKSRENRLFDAETMQKYQQLQEAFQDIMTPELRAALEKLQQALEAMDPEKVKSALKQFQTTRDQFSRELDRMIQLFQRIKIEQSVDELVRRLEDLTLRQEHLNKSLERTDSKDKAKMRQLADEEDNIQRDSEIVDDIMQRTAAGMENFPIMPREQLQELHDEYRQSELSENLQNSRQSLEQGDRAKATRYSMEAGEQLQSFAEKMQALRDSMQQMAMDAVMADFNRTIRKTLQLSQVQETLQDKIKNTPRQSESLLDVAVEQHDVHRNLARITAELIELSRKTFGVPANVGKGLGQASGEMQRAIEQLEERNPVYAAQAADRATTALNLSALELMKAQQELQQSGSASGFENYLKQLQQMAGQQQGINEETQLLGVGSQGRQGALQRLAARQQQIRKSLQQLQEEIEQSSSSSRMGDLGGIARDMDEVIKDLQDNEILRRTIQRQQRILSRLLDAQKSIRTQSYKKERKSRTGEDVIRSAPDRLPADRGERRDILQERLEKALQNDYTRENEELIRRYFEALIKEGS